MKKVIALCIVMLPLALHGQFCDCEANFNWVKKTFEENDAGFAYIIEKKGKYNYQQHNKIYIDKVRKTNNPKDCHKILYEWLTFFRSGHIAIRPINELKTQHHKSPKTTKAADKNEDWAELETVSPIPNLKQQVERYNQSISAKSPYLDKIDENTIMLRIPSFGGSQKKVIDSLILANKAIIQSYPNLIIDLRNSRGGQDRSYEKILPIIYTDTIRTIGVAFLSTPLNNRRMLDLASDTRYGFGQQDKVMFRRAYNKLSKNIGQFVNVLADPMQKIAYDTVFAMPKRVGIIINEKNKSTVEQFLLAARQSSKVKLFGTTTFGALDMSNLHFVASPCREFELGYCISKSLRLPAMAIDEVGVQPDHFINGDIPKYGWIDFVIGILNE